MKNMIISTFLMLTQNGLFVLSIIVSFLLFTFLLDRLKLSDNKLIRILQLSFFLIFVFLSLSIFKELFYSDIIECSSNNKNLNLQDDPKINLSGNIVINKEGGKEIAKGLNNVASNIGLGTAIGGSAAAVASLAKTLPIPPMQKVGVAAIGGLIGGVTHAGVTALNRSLTESKNLKSSVTNNSPSSQNSPTSSSPKTEGYNDNFSINSPYEPTGLESLDTNPVDVLLSSILTLNICNLILILFLIFLLISKLVLSKDFNLKWYNNLQNKNLLNLQNLNKKETVFKDSIIKTLKYLFFWQRKSSLILIIIIIILLLLSNIFSIYFLTNLINHFESFCRLYLEYINK